MINLFESHSRLEISFHNELRGEEHAQLFIRFVQVYEKLIET